MKNSSLLCKQSDNNNPMLLANLAISLKGNRMITNHQGLKSLNLQPAQPIESVYSTENKGFLASIKKTVNSCKSFFGFTANHKFDSVASQNQSITNTHFKPIAVNDTTIDKIENYQEISEVKKEIYKQIYQLVSYLNSDEKHTSYEGIIRESGSSTKADAIIKKLNSHEFSFESNQIDSNTAMRAIKKLADQALHLSQSENQKILQYIEAYHEGCKELDIPNQQYIQKNFTKQDIQQKITKNVERRKAELIAPLDKQPLLLQIMMPLFLAVDAKSSENKMPKNNIAIAFANTLTKQLSPDIAFKYIHTVNDYVSTLIGREQK
ncbi:hypothetical protein GKR50_12270 [Providencia rustigianii]|nr:hypothetical protein [Providencia rustigianii]